MSAICPLSGQADMHCQLSLMGSGAVDPKRT